MLGRLHDAMPLAGGEWLISFTTRTPPGEWYDKLRESPVTVEVKKYSPGRSKDANAYCWALCTDIGKALTPPLDKETVYRDAIRAVGVYTSVVAAEWSLDTLRAKWEGHGTGWVMEVVDDAGPGRKLVRLYYGSSTYTVEEMRVLLEYLTDTAQQMQIPIPLSREEGEALLERWGKR